MAMSIKLSLNNAKIYTSVIALVQKAFSKCSNYNQMFNYILQKKKRMSNHSACIVILIISNHLFTLFLINHTLC